MVNEIMDFITAHDPDVGQAIRAEYDRQQQNIELIASENVVSSAVLAAAGTVLTNKYAEGYPGKRYYGGCQCVDVVEDIAIQRARQLFGAGFANGEIFKTQHNGCAVINHGFHSQTAAPGYAMCYAWGIRHLEGDPWDKTRIDDPEHAWLWKADANDHIYPNH